MLDALLTRDGDRRPVIAIALLAAVAGHAITDLFMTAEVTSSALFWIVLGVGSTLGANREEARPPVA